MGFYKNVKDWIEDLPKKGKVTFSQGEVIAQFPEMALPSLRSSLYRCIETKKIQPVWQGYFAVVLHDYGLRGIVPPMEYIDQLMKYLAKDYYVALLSAAEIHGAAHHAPQEFFVICNSTKLRNTCKNDTKINFVAKKTILKSHLKKIMTNSSYVDVSSPILTAFDLACYSKNVGGINRVATILNDLAKQIRFTNVDKAFMLSFSAATTQRLGYILDQLGFSVQANKLYKKARSARLKFRKIPLVIVDKTKDLSRYAINEKWKIIVNEQIDIDE
jgi:predicted transcriptional regulator of viral defense system